MAVPPYSSLANEWKMLHASGFLNEMKPKRHTMLLFVLMLECDPGVLNGADVNQ